MATTDLSSSTPATTSSNSASTATTPNAATGTANTASASVPTVSTIPVPPPPLLPTPGTYAPRSWIHLFSPTQQTWPGGCIYFHAANSAEKELLCNSNTKYNVLCDFSSFTNGLRALICMAFLCLVSGCCTEDDFLNLNDFFDFKSIGRYSISEKEDGGYEMWVTLKTQRMMPVPTLDMVIFPAFRHYRHIFLRGKGTERDDPDGIGFYYEANDVDFWGDDLLGEILRSDGYAYLDKEKKKITLNFEHE